MKVLAAAVLVWVLVGGVAVAAPSGGVLTFTGPDGTKRIVNVGSSASTGQVPQGHSVRREELWEVVQDASRTHGLDPRLVDLVIRMESGYNPRALSPKGARGVMQLMPATARAYGVKNVWDPRENIRGGVRCLSDLLRRFDSNLAFALAAYNAGPEAVERHGGVPPYQETRRYVDRILGAYHGSEWPVLTGGFGREAVAQRKVELSRLSGGPLISNVPPAGDSSLRRRLSLR